MKLLFHKYHGTGNDFILIDNRETKIHLSSRDVAWLCDRNFGIGADGLMFLTTEPGYDFGMKYFNSDGNESTMCGNGGRCITAFAQSLGIIDHSALFFAIDGEHRSEILNDEGDIKQIRLKMMDITKSKIENRSEAELGGANRKSKIMIDTGSPHLLLIVDDVSSIDVVSEGRRMRNDPQFAPDGINVDFVEITETGLFVRTYERGVENETLSCGTGVTASALAFTLVEENLTGTKRSKKQEARSEKREAKIETPGGKLTVSFRPVGDSFTDIWLEGPAEFVFHGELEVRGER